MRGTRWCGGCRGYRCGGGIRGTRLRGWAGLRALAQIGERSQLSLDVFPILRRGLELVRRVVDDAGGFGALLGTSQPMKRMYDLLERVAASESSVLITGESRNSFGGVRCRPGGSGLVLSGSLTRGRVKMVPNGWGG